MPLVTLICDGVKAKRYMVSLLELRGDTRILDHLGIDCLEDYMIYRNGVPRLLGVMGAQTLLEGDVIEFKPNDEIFSEDRVCERDDSEQIRHKLIATWYALGFVSGLGIAAVMHWLIFEVL